VVNALQSFGLWACIGHRRESRKGKRMNSPIAVSVRPHRKEDLIYQVVTVVAMVSLLASVWIF